MGDREGVAGGIEACVGVWYVRVRVAGVRVRVAGVRVRVTGGGGSPRKNLIRMDLMTDGFWGPLGNCLTFPGCPLPRCHGGCPFHYGFSCLCRLGVRHSNKLVTKFEVFGSINTTSCPLRGPSGATGIPDGEGPLRPL